MKILLVGENILLQRKLFFVKDCIFKKSKNLEKEIKFFKPDIIYFYNQEYKYLPKIYTIFITTKKLEAREKDLICFIKPFEYEKLDSYGLGDKKFTHLESAIEEIVDFSLKKKEGNYDFVNPEKINMKEIYKLYNYKNKNNNILDEEDIYNYHHKLKDIKNYFIQDFKKKINIYVPTYFRFNKTKKSIDTILKLKETSKYDIEVYIGDNNTQIKEMRDWLSGLKCNVYFSEKNEGKANIVNYLHRNARRCDYVLSIDSDLYTNDYSYNLFDKMVYILEYCYNIGIVSSNQYELSQHWFGQTVKEVIDRGINLGDTDTGVGVAGGCVLLRTTDWEKIGMYKENHDIYTGDDGILTKRIWKLGKRVVVSVDYGLVHPKPEDEKEVEYQTWKMEQWKKDNIKFLDESFNGTNKKGFYD